MCALACEFVCAGVCARAADTAGRAQGPRGRKRGPRRRRQQDKAGDAAPGAPGPSIWKKLFWMTELADNIFFCFSCLGTSHYRARRRRGAEKAGRRGRSKMEQRKRLGKEAGKKKSLPNSVFLLTPIFFLLRLRLALPPAPLFPIQMGCPLPFAHTRGLPWTPTFPLA